MGPDKVDVGTVFCRLVELTSELRNDLSGRDPEGRALSLGVTAFMGAFMATMHEGDRRACAMRPSATRAQQRRK